MDLWPSGLLAAIISPNRTNALGPRHGVGRSHRGKSTPLCPLIGRGRTEKRDALAEDDLPRTSQRNVAFIESINFKSLPVMKKIWNNPSLPPDTAKSQGEVEGKQQLPPSSSLGRCGSWQNFLFDGETLEKEENDGSRGIQVFAYKFYPFIHSTFTEVLPRAKHSKNIVLQLPFCQVTSHLTQPLIPGALQPQMLSLQIL